MKIPHNHPAHSKLVQLVKACKKFSNEYTSQRHTAWAKADKMDRSFIDVGETDKKGRKTNPFERQVYIPISRAIKDTIITYHMQVITGKRPIFRVQGRGPEDVRAAKLNEIVLDYQAERRRAKLAIYCLLNDLLKYGFGSVKTVFSRMYKRILANEQQQVFFPFPHTINNRVEKNVLAYEGPTFDTTDPYRYFPDPRVPMGKHHDGQFTGFEYERSFFDLKKLEEQGVYQNIDYLFETVRGSDAEGDENTTERNARNDVLGVTTPGGGDNGGAGQNVLDKLEQQNPQYTIDEFWIELRPSDYQLSEDPVSSPASNKPKIFKLVVAAGRVLIGVQENPYLHDGFPDDVAEYDYDGYSLFNQGYYEAAEGLQDLLNWLYNSHISNVRSFLNNTVIIDPSMIELRDITNPNPARVIRKKKTAYGQNIPIRDIVQQLQFTDVTQGHLRDAASIVDTLERRFHTSSAMQGIETEIKRTATEIAKMQAGGSNHMAVAASLIYTQALVPLTEKAVMMNQQFLSEERFYRITGDAASKVLQPDPRFPDGKAVMVKPEDIMGFFDFPVDDGSLPTNPADNAEIWRDILVTGAQLPPISQRIDLWEIFKEMASSLNVKDIERFDLSARVLPDQQIENMVQAGDVIPVGGGGGPI